MKKEKRNFVQNKWHIWARGFSVRSFLENYFQMTNNKMWNILKRVSTENFELLPMNISSYELEFSFHLGLMGKIKEILFLFIALFLFGEKCRISIEVDILLFFFLGKLYISFLILLKHRMCHNTFCDATIFNVKTARVTLN